MFTSITLCTGCSDDSKTYPLTKWDIMVIFKNGYMNGYLGNSTYSKKKWKKDSLYMDSFWK